MESMSVASPMVCGSPPGRPATRRGRRSCSSTANQCHLSWARQLNDAALARDFRMAAFDLRGTGSDNRTSGPLYRRCAMAGDVAAVIAAAG